MFDGDSDGLLTHEEFTRAVQQGCAQKRGTQVRENDRGERTADQSKRSDTMGQDALSVIVRILDPGATGKIRVESLTEFVFQSSAQQSPASRGERMLSKMMISQATASTMSQESPIFGAPECGRPSSAVGFKAQEIGAHGLFLEAPSQKTLDPWATHDQLNNVIVAVIFLHELRSYSACMSSSVLLLSVICSSGGIDEDTATGHDGGAIFCPQQPQQTNNRATGSHICLKI